MITPISRIFDMMDRNCTEADIERIRIILQYSRIDVNAFFINHQTLLTRVMEHFLPALNSLALLDAGVDINTPDRAGNYAIWYLLQTTCSEEKQRRLTPFFLQHNADISVCCQGVNIPEYLPYFKRMVIDPLLSERLRLDGIQPTILLHRRN